MHLSWLLIVVFASMAMAAAAVPESPIVLQNNRLSLSFDAKTGAWIGFADRQTGEQLVAGEGQRGLVPLDAAPKPDMASIARAVADGKAVSLEGEWLYTPTPPKESETGAFLQGRFEGVKWQPTPVPSRRETGDGRLHNRVGDFWYRREFTLPDGWPSEGMALVIGAVDDFDVTYLNGARIGSTGAETPHHWESPRLYRIPPQLLRPGLPNVLLVRVTNGAYDGGISGPVVVGPASALRVQEATGPPLTAHSLSRRNRTSLLRLTARAGDYEYTMEYVLPDDQSAFTRQTTVKNIAGQEKVFQNALCVTPPLSAGPEQAVIFPGSLPVGDNPAARMQEGEVIGPRSQDPLVVLWDESKRRGIGAWYHCEEEYAPVSVRRSGGGAEIRHAQGIVIRLKPGESVTLGKQYLWLADGSRDDALRGVQQVYKAIGLRAPAGGMPRLGEKVMYCGHPGGPPELNFRTYGGFNAVRAYLPTLKKMGMDLLWFLPIWEHGDGARWNLYSPFDHFKISPLYGTPEELKQLSAACAESGIRLIFDLVPHGPPDSTPLAKEHPEWVCRDPDGKFHYEWSQYAFDNALPGWQDYMRRAAEFDARQYGAIGARVDCGAGGPLNWNPAAGNRPSLSTLAGGLGMNRAIREGFLKAGKPVVLLPEEYTGANIFYRVADLTYDAQFYYLMMDLQDRNAAPEEWARALQQFLHDQQQTLPPGALKMRWISNHDTVSWTFQKQRPVKVYGVERMRALLALCAFIEGVPMLYQGDENPAVYGGKGESSVDFLARIYALRKKLPALRRGTADYASIHATGGVFACLRETAGQRALALISFNPEKVESTVTLPASLHGEWTDALSGEKMTTNGAIRVPMAPHQTRVFTQKNPSP
jgi:glycosidase